MTWTLTPTSKGTTLRMEQSGFRADQNQFYQGAKMGRGNFFASSSTCWRGKREVDVIHPDGEVTTRNP